MVTTARQFIGGDFGDIFDQAFFSQGGEGELSAEIIAVSATLLRVRNEADPSRTTDLVGSGFAVSPGPDPAPTAGTITEFRFFRGDTLLGTLASGPIGAVAFASALAADDDGDPAPLDNLFLNEPFRLDAAQANDRVRFEADDDDDGDDAPRAPFGDTLIGSAFDDTLEGDAGADLIQAGAGRRDRLFGGPGADTLDGGEGTGDELRYGLEGGPRGVFVNLITNRAIDTFGDTDVLIGIERAAGTALDDTMVGDDASNVFRSRGGNDVFNGGGGFDRINYFGAPGGVAVNLATGVALNGFGGTDTLTSVEDVTGSNFGDDTIIGSDADNFLEGFDGADTYDGRGGFDTVDYSSEHNDGGTRGVVANLTTGQGTDTFGDAERYANIERIRGSVFADTLIGSASDDRLEGGAGADMIMTGAGDRDEITGGAGNDTLDGGAGARDEVAYEREDGTRGVFVNLITGQAIDSFGDTDTLIGIERVRGTRFDDVFVGNDANNVLEGGGGGADRFDGRGGFDTAIYFNSDAGVTARLDGQPNAGDAAGDVYIGIEGLSGSNFNDLVVGDAGDNYIEGNDGSDRQFGLDGDDTLDGSDNENGPGPNASDTLNGGAGFDFASYNFEDGAVIAQLNGQPNFGEAEGDVYINIEGLIGSNFGDSLVGSNGANVLRGELGADRLFGNGGDDTLMGGEGADTLDGGGGVDIASYARASAAVIARLDGAVMLGEAAGDVFREIEGLEGSDFDDALVSGEGGEILSGGLGADRLFGFGGRDQLFGEAGDDTLDGGLGADLLDGGAGLDTATYASATAAVGARLDGGVNFGQAAGEVIRGVELLIGSAFADALVGSDGGNVLSGGAGDDRLFGFAGRDQLFGEAGNDTLDGGLGADLLDGGAGFDTASYAAATAAVGARLDGLANFGQAAGEVIRGVEALVGSRFADVLVGGASSNVIEGGAGSDRLFGLDGRDLLRGGGGNDTLSGGAGADVLEGEAGNDDLSGALGADLFVFAGPGFGVDVIRGFEDGADRLDFRGFAGLSFADLTITGGATTTRIDVGTDTIFALGPAFGDLDQADMLFAG